MENHTAEKATSLPPGEKQRRFTSSQDVRDMPAEDVQCLIQELRADRMALEMQSEAMRQILSKHETGGNRYEEIYNSAPVGYFIMDEEGLIQEVNVAGARLLGMEKESLKGKPFAQFIDQNQLDTFLSHRQTLIETRAKQICELHLTQQDGLLLPVQLECVAITDEAENIVGFRAITIDIEKRTKSLNAIKQAKREWEATFDAISDWVCLLDLKHRILRTNRSVRRFTGLSAREVVGKTCCDVVHAGEKPRANCPLLRMLKTGAREHTEFHVPEKNAWLSVTADPVTDEDGTLVGIVHIVRDVTLLKNAEEERSRLEKIESLGVFAGGLAHDFNNLLMIISGNLALMEPDAVLTTAFESLRAEARKACARAAKLTQQLLTFAKGGEPVRKTASLAEVVRESAEFALKGSGIRCDFTIAENVLAADIDVGQISQVIHNLVINAEQAMPDGGVIAITIKNMAPYENDALPDPAGRYVKISVKDHGGGMDAVQCTKIFDPYFTTKDKGSGLGLSIVHSIIKKHGGHITVGSEPGRGTTFHIYLPGTKKQVLKALENPDETRPGKGRILYMDDEKQLRKLARMTLEKLGYTADTAEDGKTAIEKYLQAVREGHPFDVVIMDLTIPGGMGGKETLQALKKIDPQVKAVVASGYSNDPVMANFRSYGFKGVLSKPFSLSNLSQLLGRLTCKHT